MTRSTSIKPRDSNPALPSALVLLAVLILSACSLIGGDEWTEPLPIAEIVDQAATESPAAWPADIPQDWPIAIPAPAFVEGDSTLTSTAGGNRSIRLITDARPSDSDVAAYIALLFENGFVVDTRAASPGWLVRDDTDWIGLQNVDLTDFLREDASTDGALSFHIEWTTNPARLGYCSAVASGGERCLDS